MITRRLKLCTNVIMNIIVITKATADTVKDIARGTVKDMNAITMKKATTAMAADATEKDSGAGNAKAPEENAKILKSLLTED